MVDGMLDLLTAIIVLGVVVSIAFGFIVPLTKDESMHAQYDDKGAMYEASVIGLNKANFEVSEDETVKKFTYPELIMMIDIQDDRLEEPTSLSLRNLSYLDNSKYFLGITKDKSLEKIQNEVDNLARNDPSLHYLNTKGLNYAFEITNAPYGGHTAEMIINDSNEQSYLNINADFLPRLIFILSDNDAEAISDDPLKKPLFPEVTSDNDDTFINKGMLKLGSNDFTKNKRKIAGTLSMIGTLSGAEGYQDSATNTSVNPDKEIILDASKGGELSITGPKDSTNYEKNKVYSINYHIAVPDDSVYLNNQYNLMRTYDDEPSWWVEIEDKDGTFFSANLDTKKDYIEYLRFVQENVLG